MFIMQFHTHNDFLAKQIVKNKKLKITTTLHGTDITLVGLSGKI